jgi:hypothetical protein
MTPWQFKTYIDGFSDRKEQEHKHSAWIMYHGAALARASKMPPLTAFIEHKKPVKGIDEAAIMARLKAYKKRYAQEVACPSQD